MASEGSTAVSLVGAGKVKVSSVLNDDKKQYGGKHLLDGDVSTCWNSDQGLPQWVEVRFESPVTVSAVSLTFQGGFAATNCVIAAGQDKKGELDDITTVHPVDENLKQEFSFEPVPCKRLRMTFSASSDFYGRIIMYAVDVRGPSGGGAQG